MNNSSDLTPLLSWAQPMNLILRDNAIDDLSPLLAMPWDFSQDCVDIDLTGNPLAHPDNVSVVESLTDTPELDCDQGGMIMPP